MPTSGESVSIITVDDTLSSAIAMTGKRPEDMTSQDWRLAKDTLYRYLLDLSNRGINLWTIEKKLIGLIPGQCKYELPDGTVDELDLTYRYLSIAMVTNGGSASSTSGNASNAFDGNIDTSCTQTSANGWIQFHFPTAVSAMQFGIMSNGDNYYSLVFEYSVDGVTWNTIYQPDANTLYPDRQWDINEISATQLAAYYRVRETGGNTLNVRSVMFGFNPQDITISRTSRDQYSNLTQKWLTQRQPTQFWVDRRMNAPVLNIWPVPSYAFDQLGVYYHRHIEAVGSLTDELEIPLRWQQAIMYRLAMNLCLVLPGTDMSRMQYLKQMDAESYMTAATEERDNSPIMITPGIQVYNR